MILRARRAGEETGPCSTRPTSRSSSARSTTRRASRSAGRARSEEHTSELQSRQYLVCRLLLEKKKKIGYRAQREERSQPKVEAGGQATAHTHDRAAAVPEAHICVAPTVGDELAMARACAQHD